MATPKELRQAVVDARADLHSAFHSAHDTWETKPAGGEGEDAWSPRQVAQHIIGAELFFAGLIAQACGAPPLERQVPNVESPADAAASLTRFSAMSDEILSHVTEDDLAKVQQTRLGELSVQQMLALIVSHAHDHAKQIRAAG